jgi:hypothetical protein
MEELTTFVYIGDNDHDDAPDGVTQLMMSITEKRLAEVSAVQNPSCSNHQLSCPINFTVNHFV